MSVPRQQDIGTIYSHEIERIRRQELRTGGGPSTLFTDWIACIFVSFGGPLFEVGWFRLHYGCVFLAGLLVPGTVVGAWRQVGVLPDYATPPVEHVVYATVIPNFGSPVVPTPNQPQPALVPVRILTDGSMLYPASEYSSGVWLHGVEPHFDLMSSYFPLG